MLLLLLLLKPAVQPSSKNKVVYKLLSKPHKQLRHGKQENCTLEPIQRSGVKYSVGKVIPQSNLIRQERPSKLGRSTP